MNRFKKYIYFVLFSSVFLLCSFGFVNNFVDAEDIIYPYLQNVTTTGIEVSWTSPTSATGGNVVYGLTNLYGSSTTEILDPILVTSTTPTIYIHKVIISGLLANTTYHFMITDYAGLTSADSTFLTAPVDGTPFNFLVYGDNANNTDSPRTALYTIAVNEAATIVPNNPQTIALQLGDHTNSGNNDEWQPQFFLPEKDILKNTPIYNVYGNHDTLSTAPTLFSNYFDPPVSSGSTETYYSFNYGNVHFVVLDGNISRAKPSTQYTWLETDMATIAAQNADWRVLLTHQPGLAYGGGHGSSDDNGLMSAITSLSSEMGVTKNFDLVLMGHNHVYERDYNSEGIGGGITWVTVGTVGGTPAVPTTCAPGSDLCPSLQYTAQQGYGYMIFLTSHNKITGKYYYTDAIGAEAMPVLNDTFNIGFAPSGCFATYGSNTQSIVNWTDNSTIADRFKIERKTDGGDWTQIGTSDSSPYTDNTISFNHSYQYRVRAYNTLSNSDYSTDNNIIYTLANIPSSLALTVDSANQITASWSANSNPAGTKYYIENTTASTNSGWVTDTSWVSSGLTCGTTYTFKVEAENINNTSTSFTDTVLATTSACPSNGGGGGGGGGGNYVPPTKNMTSFSFSQGAGVITGNNIMVNVPHETDVTKLVATFVSDGSSVKSNNVIQISGITVNDFTNSVIYSVIASDNSAQNYTVTVVKSSINLSDPTLIQKEIDRIKKIILELQNQIAQISGQQSNRHIFTKNLQLGDFDPEVKYLQQYLNNNGFVIAQTGSGSLGNETEYFGQRTKQALIKFQEKYSNEVLAPAGLTRGVGIVGFYTRKKLNGQ